jgi:hypothetical protein
MKEDLHRRAILPLARLAVFDWARRGWRRLTMAPKGLRLPHDLRRQLRHPAVDKDVVIDEAVTTAA